MGQVMAALEHQHHAFFAEAYVAPLPVRFRNVPARPEDDLHEVDELLPVWLKPCGEPLTLGPVNGAKVSSGGGVEGGHPKR